MHIDACMGIKRVTPRAKIALFLIAATTFAVGANAQVNKKSEPGLTGELEPLRPGVAKVEVGRS
jgi:hypothetical protein